MTTRRLIVTAILSVLALGFIFAVGVGIYVNYFSSFAPTLAGQRTIAIARALDRNLQNRTGYVPPPDGRMTEGQIERFVKVEQEVERASADASQTLGAASENLTRLEASRDGLRAADALRSIGAVETPFRRAKAAQIKALNAAIFSKDEYEWVRRRVYAAAGIELLQLSLEDLSHADAPDDLARIHHERPDPAAGRDQQRVERHRASLQRWRGLAFFGL